MLCVPPASPLGFSPLFRLGLSTLPVWIPSSSTSSSLTSPSLGCVRQTLAHKQSRVSFPSTPAKKLNDFLPLPVVFFFSPARLHQILDSARIPELAALQRSSQINRICHAWDELTCPFTTQGNTSAAKALNSFSWRLNPLSAKRKC